MRIGESIKLLLLAYSPFIRGDKKQVAELRRIIKKLKESGNGFFDPVRRNFTPYFHSFVEELIRQSSLLRNVYRSTFNGNEKQRQNFERGLAAHILRSLKQDPEELTFSAVRKIGAESNNTGINNLDRIFSGKLKYFTHKDFKACSSSLIVHSILADFADVDLTRITEEFPKTRNGEPDRLDAELITDSLEDIYFTSRKLTEVGPDELSPVFKYLAQLHSPDSPDEAYSELMEHSMNLIQMLELLHENDFILNVLRLLRDDPEYQPAVGSCCSDFPEHIKKACSEQYSKYRQLYIQKSNQELLKSRIAALFGRSDLLPVHVYNHDTSQIFTDNGLPAFKYVNAFRICKSFYALFFEPDIRPAIQTLLLEAEFHHEADRNYLSDCFEYAVLTGERITKFEEDLSIPSFSLIAPYIEKLKVGIIEKKEKLRAEKAVEKLGKDVDEIIQQVFAVFTDLHTRLSKLIIDIADQNPKILTNALYLRNRKNEFCELLESAEARINSFLKLLRSFSINLADAKTGIKARDGH